MEVGHGVLLVAAQAKGLPASGDPKQSKGKRRSFHVARQVLRWIAQPDQGPLEAPALGRVCYQGGLVSLLLYEWG